MIRIINAKEKELEFYSFPGGELNFNHQENDDFNTAVIVNTPTFNNIGEDLIKLGLWADYCKQLKIPNKLIMGYIPAARADRGVPLGVKVYTDIINSFNIDEIIVLDPHSPVSVSILKNVKIANMAELMSLGLNLKKYTGIIAPDEGSIHRATQIANMLNVPVYFGVKKRDFSTGRILDYTIELNEVTSDDKLLVVDDICDGGGTFNYLSQVSKLPKEQLDLWVTHGIFSGNAAELLNHYEEVYTTNTVTPYHDLATVTVDANKYMLTGKI